MTRLVVDASALASVMFREPGHEAIVDRLERAELYAPTLLRFEIANVAISKMRRRPADAAGVLMALALILDEQWAISWRDVDLVDAGLIAHATGLTVYDASYLWLAATLGADLVTLDRQLAAVDALV